MDNDRGSDVQTEVTRGWMDRVDDWKSRGSELVHSVSRSISTKTSDMKRMTLERTSRVKPMIHDKMDMVDRDLHTNPAKWAGIAAGAGFLLGMIGRELRHRRYSHRAMPELIIIETA